MSDAQWFWVIFGGEGVAIVLMLWLGLRKQTNRFGCFVQRAEQIVERGETVAIQFRSYVAYLHDLERERRTDHPVIPPDAFPDALQEKEVA